MMSMAKLEKYPNLLTGITCKDSLQLAKTAVDDEGRLCLFLVSFNKSHTKLEAKNNEQKIKSDYCLSIY